MTKETNHNEIDLNTNTSEVVAVEESHGVTHEATLYAEHIGDIGPMPVTNALFTSWIVVGVIVIFALVLKFKIKQVPRGIQNFFEFVIDGAMSLADQVTGDRKISEKAFPMVFPVFIFILLSNWMGILPLGGFGLLEQTDHGQAFIPLIRSGTADINGNLALALISILGANIFGIISIGLWKTINKYVNLNALGSIFTKIKKDPIIILTAPIMFAIGFLELIGEFAKIASLSFRLFGNVFAGEVLLASMAAVLAYAVPIPFLILEVFVGVIQAFIFAILTLVYYTIASQDHEDHDEHEDHSKTVQDGAVAH
ncbi:MAG: FoF1 ATP synthase subunit a [Candidatus Paceibacterota bacterium]